MMYLIAQLAPWLLLTAAFAALAGWAFAERRAQADVLALRREREGLVRNLGDLAGGEGVDHAAEDAREAEARQSLADIREGRIAQLERALEQARARVDEAAGEIAELQRRLERQNVDAADLERLRALAPSPADVVDAESTPVEDDAEDERVLQMWRLRYFEQRVRYLEGRNAAQPVQPIPAAPVEPAFEWRAREAEARVAHLEQELRALSAAAPAHAAPESDDGSPFAANADVDMLLRWRLLYLERRVAHLQEAAAQHAPQAAPTDGAGADPDRWKWRARYLEARLRHLEQRPPIVSAPAPEATTAVVVAEVPQPAPAPRANARKPSVLAAARNGAPDDFTLIDDVSALQQSTLNALGVFHFDQIAAWTSENVAWIDSYLRLRGRIEEEEWVEQAAALARDGPAAARRAMEDEEA